jgi:hypothetical protein
MGEGAAMVLDVFAGNSLPATVQLGNQQEYPLQRQSTSVIKM